MSMEDFDETPIFNYFIDSVQIYFSSLGSERNLHLALEIGAIHGWEPSLKNMSVGGQSSTSLRSVLVHNQPPKLNVYE